MRFFVKIISQPKIFGDPERRALQRKKKTGRGKRS